MNKYLFKVKFFSPTDFVLSYDETDSVSDYQTAEEITSILIYAHNSGGLTNYFEELFTRFNCVILKTYLIVGDIALKECKDNEIR